MVNTSLVTTQLIISRDSYYFLTLLMFFYPLKSPHFLKSRGTVGESVEGLER